MRALLALLLLPFAVLPAAAQDAPAQPCELHVWPADGMGRVSQTAFNTTPSAAGLIPAIIRRNEQASDAKAESQMKAQVESSGMLEPMAPATQVEILKSLPLAELLGLPGHVVVIHDIPLDSRTIRTVKTRYTETAAPCYADLVVDDVTYSTAFASGRSLKSFFRFRDFGTQTAPVRSFGTWVETGLGVFSVNPPNLSKAALDELASAYRNNVRRFSDLLRKRPPPSRQP